MIAVQKYWPFALLSGALFIGFFGWGPINVGTTGRWDVRCNLHPETTLAKEISQCHEVLDEQVYEGEALGEVYFRLGYFHHQLGDWQIAYAYYQTARKMRPARVSAHYNSALILRRYTQDWQGVFDAASDVIDLIPPVKSHHSNAWALRAYALHKLGRGAEALPDIAVALSIDPEERALIRLRSRINLTQDDT